MILQNLFRGNLPCLPFRVTHVEAVLSLSTVEGLALSQINAEAASAATNVPHAERLLPPLAMLHDIIGSTPVKRTSNALNLDVLSDSLVRTIACMSRHI